MSSILSNFYYQQDFGVTVQKFRVAGNDDEAAKIPGDFPCSEYVIKAQVLAGGRGKGHFDNGFKGGVHLTKDPSKVAELCTAMIGHKYVSTTPLNPGSLTVIPG